MATIGRQVDMTNAPNMHPKRQPVATSLARKKISSWSPRAAAEELQPFTKTSAYTQLQQRRIDSATAIAAARAYEAYFKLERVVKTDGQHSEPRTIVSAK